jgi:NAD+ synthase
MDLKFDAEYLDQVIADITKALRSELGKDGRAVIGLSGGLDSDAVARLTVRAVGRERLKLFTVLQEGMEEQHRQHARLTAEDLGIPLRVLDLGSIPHTFITAMAAGDSDEAFQPDGLLDPSRAKCSLRTAIFSTYQDRGYIVIGTSNKTEIETGFFMPFGDGVWHFGPIAHLYKSQVIQVAHQIGTRVEVIAQPASAGFWPGQQDLEDLAYWLYNWGPIGPQRSFTDDEDAEVHKIYNMLTTEGIDSALFALAQGDDDAGTAQASGLPMNIVARLRRVWEEARRSKQRPFGRRLVLP